MSIRNTARRAGHHLPMLGWLWLLWVLLWGRLSAVVLLAGLLVAVAIVTAFPLPPILPHMTLRPLRLAWLLGHLVADVAASAVTVAWEAVRHGSAPRRAIVEVPLRVDSDLLIAATASLATLTPGTLVLEIDREHRLLYAHALPVRDREEAEHRRREVQEAENRVVRAFGRDGGGAGRDAARGPEREGEAP